MRQNKGPPTREDMEIAARVYERHKGVMYKTVLEHIRDRSEADAAVHEALMRLARCAGTLERLDEKALAVYAAETVRSTVLDLERRRGAELRHITEAAPETLEALGADPGPEAAYLEREARQERSRRLREALFQLSETDRELLIGRYILGESDEVLARRVGVLPASVSMKLTRARRRARRLMEGKEAEGHES